MGPRPAGTAGCCSATCLRAAKQSKEPPQTSLGCCNILANGLWDGLSPTSNKEPEQRHCWHVFSEQPNGNRSCLAKLVPGQYTNPGQKHKAISDLPWAIVFLSSSRLRKDNEATWGFPHLAVSSSTSSSNLIQRAVSLQCISWFLSTTSSFSSTNTCANRSEDVRIPLMGTVL